MITKGKKIHAICDKACKQRKHQKSSIRDKIEGVEFN